MGSDDLTIYIRSVDQQAGRCAVTRAVGSEGAAWAVIARETGLGVPKLQRWNARARPAASVPVLRPVEVVQEPEPSQALALIAPSGVRVEGLGVQEAAQLLRLLA